MVAVKYHNEYNNAMVQWFDFPGIQMLDRR